MPGLLRVEGGGGSSSLFRGGFKLAVRRYAIQSSAAPVKAGRRIAVLGGGISGLTMALQLVRRLPAHEIHLYEAKKRVGGWVESERVKIGGDLALVEGGPRSIRPASLPGLAMMSLIRSLGLEERMLSIPKTHPSAKNRYIFHSGKVNLLPNSLTSALLAVLTNRPPRLRSIIPALIHDFRTPPDLGAGAESVEDFFRRRLGPAGLKIIDNAMSAVLHGIYAADTKDLGIRSIFGFLALAEKRHGGLIRAAMPKRWNRFYRTDEVISKDNATARDMIAKEKREGIEQLELEEQLGKATVDYMKTTSIFSFKEGIQELTDAIEEDVVRRGVTIHRGDPIKEIRANPQRPAKIVLQGGHECEFDRVVSAMPSNDLAAVWKGDPALGHLLKTDTSTVAVLNLAIRSPNPLRVPDGFGYLVPRASVDTNTLGLLGVVFDSAAVPGQESSEGNITKLTMMLGGPFFRKGFTVFDQLRSLGPGSWGLELGIKGNDDDDVPQQVQELASMAIDTLCQNLGISKEVLAQSTIKAKLRLQVDCIPRYDRYHLERMKELHHVLKHQEPGGGCLTLIGASYTGISVNDCVLNASRTANILADDEGTGARGIVTGLEHLAQ